MLKRTLLLVVLLMAVSFTTVFAQMGMMGKSTMMDGGMMGMMRNPEMCIMNAEKAGLSDEQLKEFKSFHFEHGWHQNGKGGTMK